MYYTENCDLSVYFPLILTSLFNLLPFSLIISPASLPLPFFSQLVHSYPFRFHLSLPFVYTHSFTFLLFSIQLHLQSFHFLFIFLFHISTPSCPSSFAHFLSVSFASFTVLPPLTPFTPLSSFLLSGLMFAAVLHTSTLFPFSFHF